MLRQENTEYDVTKHILWSPNTPKTLDSDDIALHQPNYRNHLNKLISLPLQKAKKKKSATNNNREPVVAKCSFIYLRLNYKLIQNQSTCCQDFIKIYRKS